MANYNEDDYSDFSEDDPEAIPDIDIPKEDEE